MKLSIRTINILSRLLGVTHVTLVVRETPLVDGEVEVVADYRDECQGVRQANQHTVCMDLPPGESGARTVEAGGGRGASAVVVQSLGV